MEPEAPTASGSGGGIPYMADSSQLSALLRKYDKHKINSNR